MKRALLVLALATPAVADDTNARCEQIAKTMANATDVRSLLAALVDGSHPGITQGELGELPKNDLVSFCVLVDPPIPVEPCLKPLGFTKPIVHRALTQRVRWSIANNVPRKGKPLATKLPRLGPVVITPSIAKPNGKQKAGSPAKLPFHALDRKRDEIVEVCLVDAKVGR